MRRTAFPLPVLVLIAGLSCKAIDNILEEDEKPTWRVQVGLPATSLSLAQGAEQVLAISVTKVGEQRGNVSLTFDDVPANVTTIIGASTTDGMATTFSVIFRVGPTAAVGNYFIKVNGFGDRVSDSKVLSFQVLDLPAYTLGLAKSSVTIIRGGIAPVGVTLTRANYTEPITLALSGTAGITAAFSGNPVSTQASTATIAVDPSVAPGTYTMTVSGTSNGASDRTATISVTVSNDALQVVTGSSASLLQGSSLSSDVIVNRNGYTGPVTLSVENLPANVTASFDPASPTGNTSTLTIIAAPSAANASALLTLRASGSGVSDATATVDMAVAASAMTLTVTPDTVAVFQGTSSPTNVAITRLQLPEQVALSFQNVPPGVTITASPASMTGTTSTLTVAASGSATPGEYDVTVTATPTGRHPAMAKSKTLHTTVKVLPTGSGNVIFDWSTCTAPEWLAFQDGTGAWTRVVPVGGIFGFTINSVRGGVAYARGSSLVVMFRAQAELIGGPITMCPPAIGPTKSIHGSGIHISAAETFTYALGGGTATSSFANPPFTIHGVREGPQDLVAWGTTQSSGLRGLIRRDVDLPNGETLGNVEMTGLESFVPERPMVVLAGGTIVAGETVGHTMDYLTTPACVVNPLYTVNGLTGPGLSTMMFGMPKHVQRPSDFHQITVALNTPNRLRATTVAFNEMLPRTILLPPPVNNPTVVPLIGANYRRFQASANAISSAYNQQVEFIYTNGPKTTSVSASKDYLGNTTTYSVTTPIFTGVAGWQDSYGIDLSATGSWQYFVRGQSGGSNSCTEGRTTVSSRHVGSF